MPPETIRGEIVDNQFPDGIRIPPGKTIEFEGGGPTLDAFNTVEPVDPAPDPPNAKDDEFTDADKLPGGGSAIWSWQNEETSIVTLTGAPTSYVVLTPNDADIHAITQPVPVGNWTITTKLFAALGAADSLCGLIASPAGAGERQLFMLWRSAADFLLRIEKWTSDTVFGSQQAASGSFLQIRSAIWYLRMSWNGTQLTCEYSLNGFAWELLNTFTPGSTPGVFGLVARTVTVAACKMYADYFRVT
jgi:hypothetical protein